MFRFLIDYYKYVINFEFAGNSFFVVQKKYLLTHRWAFAISRDNLMAMAIGDNFLPIIVMTQDSSSSSSVFYFCTVKIN